MRLAVEHNGRADVGEIGRGDPSTAATVASIQAVLDWSLFEHERSRAALRNLCGSWSAKSRRMEDFASILWDWAARSVVFEADPAGVEVLTTPVSMLDAIGGGGSVRGDCKKLSTLLAALIASAGWTPALVTCGKVDASLGGDYQHIFAAVRRDPGAPLSRENLYPIDPQANRRTGERTPVGEWPKDIRRLKFWGLVVTPPTA